MVPHIKEESPWEHVVNEVNLDFRKLKEGLINDDVAELAMNLLRLLSIISSKYSNDAIIKLAPELMVL